MEDSNMAKTWVPNRKVVAGAVSGLVTLAAFYLFGPEQSEEFASSVTLAVMTVISYLVPLPEGPTPNGDNLH